MVPVSPPLYRAARAPQMYTLVVMVLLPVALTYILDSILPSTPAAPV